MYPFLERVEESQIRNLVKNLLGDLTEDGVGADAAVMSRLLFAKYGFDFLADREARRRLLLTLPEPNLRTLANEVRRSSDGKSFDVALKLSALAWRFGSAAVRRMAEALQVSEDFLPDGHPREETVEVVGPMSSTPPLFDYQLEAVEALVAGVGAKPARSLLMQLPTGAGKTRTAMEALSRVLRQCAREGRFPSVLWWHTRRSCATRLSSRFGVLGRCRGVTRLD